MNTIQREKKCIQRQLQVAHAAFSYLMLADFLVSFGISPYSLARSPIVFIHAIISTIYLRFAFSLLLFFFILGFGLSLLGPFLQKMERRKQRWLNEYGLQIQAVISRYPEENALLIDECSRRNTSYRRYLHWQDPQTAQCYSYCVNTRFSSAFRNLPEGTFYPVQFDPNDLSFYTIPGK